MKFSTSNVKEGGYIRPGIQEVTISKVEGVVQNDKPRVDITMFREGGDDKSATTIRMYMSTDKAQLYALRKIKHLATNVVTEDKIDAIEAESIEDYGSQLNALLAGNNVRVKFIGEEYENQNGEIKVRANIGLPPFAEAIQEGAKHAVKTVSELKFDETNQYDFKRMERAEPSSSSEDSTSPSNSNEGDWE
jgi:hypothetical protein